MVKFRDPATDKPLERKLPVRGATWSMPLDADGGLRRLDQALAPE